MIFCTRCFLISTVILSCQGLWILGCWGGCWSKLIAGCCPLVLLIIPPDSIGSLLLLFEPNVELFNPVVFVDGFVFGGGLAPSFEAKTLLVPFVVFEFVLSCPFAFVLGKLAVPLVTLVFVCVRCWLLALSGWQTGQSGLLQFFQCAMICLEDAQCGMVHVRPSLHCDMWVRTLRMVRQCGTWHLSVRCEHLWACRRSTSCCWMSLRFSCSLTVLRLLGAEAGLVGCVWAAGADVELTNPVWSFDPFFDKKENLVFFGMTFIATKNIKFYRKLFTILALFLIKSWFEKLFLTFQRKKVEK